MVNASNTGTASETGNWGGIQPKRMLTSIVGKALSFVVALVVFGTLFDVMTPTTPMMGVIVGMSYGLAGVIILVGVIATVVWALK